MTKGKKMKGNEIIGLYMESCDTNNNSPPWMPELLVPERYECRAR
jgi:hypothetical protein